MVKFSLLRDNGKIKCLKKKCHPPSLFANLCVSKNVLLRMYLRVSL